MILYHFTKHDTEHMGSILKDQQIDARNWFPNPHDSICSFPVVCLTTDPFCHHHNWARNRLIRFTIDIPKNQVLPWLEFAHRNNIMDAYHKSLSIGTPSMWWVSRKPIPRANWREIALLDSNGHEREVIEIKPYS